MDHLTVRGVDVPALGFGTARMDDHDVRVRVIGAALEAGYRHIDTAQIYGSEPAVGEAVAASDLDRDELFITTKLAPENREHGAVLESMADSLEHLDTDYVDLLLIHSPDQEVPHEETLRAMAELREAGRVRHIGVSNFSVDELDRAIEVTDAPILTNQVKYNVRHRQDELLAACLDSDVMLTAYSPLAVGELAEVDRLIEIGERHGKTWAQVAIRWLLQQPNVITIPMSSSPDHVRENAAVFDFSLTDEEMRELFDMGGSIDEELRGTLGL